MIRGAFVASWVAAMLVLVHAARAEPHDIETYALGNGLAVVLAPDPGVTSVVATMRYRVGSADDPQGRAGLAHLIEYVASRGSRHVAEVDKLLDEAGGWASAMTSATATTFVESVPATSLELALYVEADRMAAPAQQGLEAARGALAAERDEADRTIEAALWPQRAPSLGTTGDLAAVTPAELARRWTERYEPGAATLVIAGRFEPREVRALVQRYFGWIPSHPHAAAPRATVQPLAAPVELATTSLVPRVTMAFRIAEVPSSVPVSAPELAIAARLLGTGRSARLYRRLVVADHLATAVHVEIVPEAGELTIGVELRDPAGASAARAAIRDELARLREAPVDSGELARGAHLTERELFVGLENLAFRAAELAEAPVAPRRLADLRAGLAEVTPASLQRAVQHWLADSAAVTLTSSPP